MTKISVIIPCFNLGHYLPEAVDSVRRQTHPPNELIVVDDGSNDERTLRSLRRLEEEGVQVFRTDNQGASAARNYGISRSSGEYILCLDGDDLLLPTYLEEVAPVLDQQPDVGIVSTHVEFFGAHEGIWRTREYSITSMLWQNCICTGSLYRRSCWEQAGGYKPLKGCQDWDFWISIVEQGWKWSIVPRPLYRYRRRRGSISEYREANRPELLKQVIHHHLETYKTHCADVLVQMDSEIQRLRREIVKRKKSNEGRRPRKKALTKSVLASIERLIHAYVPRGSELLVVSKGDERLIDFLGYDASHFPQAKEGAYLGYHPADDSAAVEHLESLRAKGSQFLLIPKPSLWWLDYYDAFRQHLEQNYQLVAEKPDVGVLFDISAPIERHTFSVVICTYKRAAYLGKAIASIFEQNYPKDEYELIIIDNDSPDDTAQVARDYESKSPVPYSYYVEPRNGLSHARNLGISKARFEFVAFLDDDATAVPNWLAAFNSVISTRHALVVGGRVEKVFEEGFSPPRWFDTQYLRGFFGINYRERGRAQRVFRIRYPLYIGGGNSAYARRLFPAFGGYNPQLGRNKNTLLAAEESYLNMLMDKHDIPIYYTDDAVIHHFIESARVTKKHLRSKARWSGRSNATMYSLFFGARETLRRSSKNWTDLAKLTWRNLSHPFDRENFSRWCRVLYHVSFLKQLYWIMLSNARGRVAPALHDVAWGPKDWEEEFARWPDSESKFRHLFQHYVLTEERQKAEEARQQLSAFREAHGLCEDERAAIEDCGPVGRTAYQRMIADTHELIEQVVPRGATVLAVSKGDEKLLKGKGRSHQLRHFPQSPAGEYAGYYPSESAAAIEHLENLIDRGAEYLVFPASAFWWLDHYRGLRQHLRDNYALIADEHACKIFALHRLTDKRNKTRQNDRAMATAES